jgi:molybdate transport system substrate-binding protein
VRPGVIVATVAVALLAAACTSVGSSPGQPSPTDAAPTPPTTAPAGSHSGPAELEVYAAASLRAAMSKATSAYAAGHPGTTFALSTDSSAALETKIEQGAPADVFLSADTANARKLVDKGLAAGGMTIFARNHLTVVVPTGDPAGIASPLDLARTGVKIVAAGDEVPITKYADQLVADLARQPGYPADFAVRYAANIVSREDNVGAVIAKIELGEGDAAIVYATDAAATSKVRTIEVPDAADVPATYGGVVVGSSAHPGAAAAFLAWLAGPDGQAVLASFGFLAPS